MVVSCLENSRNAEWRGLDQFGSMRETSYRASRVCRFLGNPVIFAIITEHLEQGGLTPSQLGKGDLAICSDRQRALG